MNHRRPATNAILRGLLCAIMSGGIAGCELTAVPGAERIMRSDGVELHIASRWVKVQVCAPDVVRIAVAEDPKCFSNRSLAVLPAADNATPWTVTETGRLERVSTSDLSVEVERATGNVSFHDAAGHLILAQSPGGATLDAAHVQGADTYHVGQRWQASDDESLYGLGQNQLGLVDIKGYDLDLWQHNTSIALPFLLSSRGWGVYWDNASFTRFGDLRPFEPIPAECLFDSTGRPGGLTATHYSDAHFGRVVSTGVESKIDIPISDSPRRDASVTWEGSVLAPVDGDYQFQTFSNCGIKVWLDGKPVIDHWRQNWLPTLDVARPHLEAGKRYAIKVAWFKDQSGGTVRLLWKTPPTSDDIALWSEVGGGIDYYFIHGPKLDKVIAGYRKLTGQAPMMPAWSMGLFQSRQRYQTAQESLDVVAGFRKRGIPFDTIVQDWQYWKPDAWGSHEFDPSRFPDPDAWIKAIHDQHAHLMISVWGKFYPGTANFTAMHDAGFLYDRNLSEGTRDWLNHPYTFFDAFNPGARKLFWQQINENIFQRGADAWWMDASEPDLRPTPTLDGQRDYMNPTALGPGSRVLNAYSLMTSESLYLGQRQAAANQRVFILTRNAFAGEQRHAAAVWSGDISSTWTAMAKQIPAGLSMSISGLPYWTMDIGGFAVPARFSARNPKPADVEEWRELQARWFEFGTFCPLLRVHGEAPHREMWEFGGDDSPSFKAQLQFDRLRYRLLPYIYSLMGDVTQRSGTIMRPLVMDFPSDASARRVTDEYMFGPAFLVCPVTQYQARHRPVLLPAGATWYDFWTGDRFSGGQTIDADAPFDRIPIFVRAGSIIPVGPDVQYVGEKPADPITLQTYPGADGEFSLYEDDGGSYDYERGASSRIDLHWDNSAGVLTIGKREGEFPGMLRDRTFNLAATGQAVSYHGEQIQVRAEAK